MKVRPGDPPPVSAQEALRLGRDSYEQMRRLGLLGENRTVLAAMERFNRRPFWQRVVCRGEHDRIVRRFAALEEEYARRSADAEQ